MKRRILFLAANPTTQAWLALDEECRAIEVEIRASEYRDSLELITKWAVRPNDLLQYFHQHKPDVVHFSGHGTTSGEIMLVGKNRKSKTVATSALTKLFSALKDNIRVVVLNACYSKVQANALTRVVDCCIGMNEAIRDDAAIVFSAGFYQALGGGRSVKVAFDCGIAAMELQGIRKTMIPELLYRPHINPNKVFVLRSRIDKPRQRSGASSIASNSKMQLPRMLAKFQEVDGELWCNTGGSCPEYGMDLWIENAPPETKAVAFEIFDKSFKKKDRQWTKTRQFASVLEFLTDDMSSYGDVEIWIKGLGKGRGTWLVQTSLYEALNRHYDQRSRTKEIQRALKQIRDN